MPTMAQARQRIAHLLVRHQEVTDDHHQRTVRPPREQLVHRARQVSLPVHRMRRQALHDGAPVALRVGAACGGNELRPEHLGGHAVALREPEERHRGGGGRGVVELGPARSAARLRAAPAFLAAQRAEAHAPRGIHHDVDVQVRLLLETLEIQLVAAAEHLPVDVPDRIARHVLAMLRELHRQPLVGRTVHAAHHALGDALGAQLERAELGECLGCQVLLCAHEAPFTSPRAS